jgi:aryl-alcohol dehydrogenase-like predicted oxidoreductase
MAQLAINFILSQKEVSVVLPTISDIEELETFAEMSNGKCLVEKDMSEIKKIYDDNFGVA